MRKFRCAGESSKVSAAKRVSPSGTAVVEAVSSTSTGLTSLLLFEPDVTRMADFSPKAISALAKVAAMNFRTLSKPQTLSASSFALSARNRSLIYGRLPKNIHPRMRIGSSIRKS